MVRRIEWLSPVDIYVLQLFADTDLILTPKVIAVNTDYEQSYVGKRCRALTERGLLAREERGLYSLTDAGRVFVESGFDPAALDEL